MELLHHIGEIVVRYAGRVGVICGRNCDVGGHEEVAVMCQARVLETRGVYSRGGNVCFVIQLAAPSTRRFIQRTYSYSLCHQFCLSRRRTDGTASLVSRVD